MRRSASPWWPFCLLVAAGGPGVADADSSEQLQLRQLSWQLPLAGEPTATIFSQPVSGAAAPTDGPQLPRLLQLPHVQFPTTLSPVTVPPSSSRPALQPAAEQLTEPVAGTQADTIASFTNPRTAGVASASQPQDYESAATQGGPQQQVARSAGTGGDVRSSLSTGAGSEHDLTSHARGGAFDHRPINNYNPHTSHTGHSEGQSIQMAVSNSGDDANHYGLHNSGFGYHSVSFAPTQRYHAAESSVGQYHTAESQSGQYHTAESQSGQYHAAGSLANGYHAAESPVRRQVYAGSGGAGFRSSADGFSGQLRSHATGAIYRTSGVAHRSSSNAYRTTQQPYRHPNGGNGGYTYTASNLEYGPPKKGYEAPKKGYETPSTRHVARNMGHTTRNKGYRNPTDSYGTPNENYGVPYKGYGPPNNGYKFSNIKHGATDQNHKGSNQNYGAPSSSYGPSKGGAAAGKAGGRLRYGGPSSSQVYGHGKMAGGHPNSGRRPPPQRPRVFIVHVYKHKPQVDAKARKKKKMKGKKSKGKKKHGGKKHRGKSKGEESNGGYHSEIDSRVGDSSALESDSVFELADDYDYVYDASDADYDESGGPCAAEAAVPDTRRCLAADLWRRRCRPSQGDGGGGGCDAGHACCPAACVGLHICRPWPQLPTSTPWWQFWQ